MNIVEPCLSILTEKNRIEHQELLKKLNKTKKENATEEESNDENEL